MQTSRPCISDLFVYLAKKYVDIYDGAWRVNFESDCAVRRAAGYFEPKKNPNFVRPPARKGGPPSGNATSANDLDFDDDNEFDGIAAKLVPNGDGRDDELAQRLDRDLPDLKGAKRELPKKSNMRLYSVTMDQCRGLAITYARAAQRDKNRNTFSEAKKKLSKRNVRTLSNSFSMRYATKGCDSYVKNSVALKQWRISRMYGKGHVVSLTKDMATP